MSPQGQAVHGASQMGDYRATGHCRTRLGTLAQIGGFLLNNRQRTHSEISASYSFITVTLKHIDHQVQMLSFSERSEEKGHLYGLKDFYSE